MSLSTDVLIIIWSRNDNEEPRYIVPFSGLYNDWTTEQNVKLKSHYFQICYKKKYVIYLGIVLPCNFNPINM